MEFLGYELVRVGYIGDNSIEYGETKWQKENRGWMDKMEIDSVGKYFVMVKKDDFIYLYNDKWDSVLDIKNDWNWIVKIAKKGNLKQISTNLKIAFKECSMLVF